MGDVKVGDELLSADGLPTKVTAAFEVRHDRPCYEVEFSDGSVIVADGEHLWKTTTRASRRAAPARRRNHWSPEAIERLHRAAAGAAPGDDVTIAELAAVLGPEFTHTAHRVTRDIADESPVVMRRRPRVRPARAYPARRLYRQLLERVEQWSESLAAAELQDVVTTEQIRATLRTNTADRRLNHAVENAAALRLPERELPLAPYTLGVWLGDGHTAEGRVTTVDPEILAGIESDGFEVRPSGPMVYTIRPRLPAIPDRECVVCHAVFTPRGPAIHTCGQSCGGRSKGLVPAARREGCAHCGRVDASAWNASRRCRDCHKRYGSFRGYLRAAGVLGDKHVPAAYLRASEAQRRALLAGLLDTDGTVTVSGNVQFTTTSPRLAEDVHELVVSLGYRCSVSRKTVKGRTAESSIAFNLNFTTRDEVFRLTRKREAHRLRRRSESNSRTDSRFIVDVRPVASVPVRCVTVDNPEHLYLAGRAMIPTHNSTASMDFARNAAIRANQAAAIFSLEMSKVEIVMRLLSAEARVPLHVLRSGQLSDDDWTKLARCMGEISEAPLFVDDTPSMNLMEIRAKARRLKQRHDLKLIVVDYLQLMTSPKRTESRQQEVADLSRGLKLLAKEVECPVIAVSQLNRGPEQRTDKRPQLSDLRESGSIEQDADVVILLHRDDYYDKESPRAGEADFIVAKHRNGPTDTVTVAAQLHLSRFVDMAIV